MMLRSRAKTLLAAALISANLTVFYVLYRNASAEQYDVFREMNCSGLVRRLINSLTKYAFTIRQYRNNGRPGPT